MLEAKQKTIGNHSYTVTQLGAVKGRKVFTRLARLIGPAAMVGGGVERMLGALVGALADEDVDYFCDTFAPMTRVTLGAYGNKQPLLSDVFDLHFQANYLEMIKWLVFCLEVNFGNFLDVLKVPTNGATDVGPMSAASLSS